MVPPVRSWRNRLALAQIAWLGAAVNAGCGSDEIPDGVGGQAPGSGSGSGAAAGAPDAVGGMGGQEAESAADGGAADVTGGRKATGGSASLPSFGGTRAAPAAGGDGSEPELPHGVVPLGGPCTATVNCVPGLACLAAGSTELGARSVPHGMCTLACDRVEDCLAFDSGALCLQLDESSNQGYCVQGCEFGEPLGAPKCRGRLDFACLPALLAPLGAACNTAADCAPGDLCTESGCTLVIPACLPQCRGDIDCPGQYCDQSFLSGTCTTVKPTGKRLGEPCTVPGPDEPREPDECRGFCQSDDGGPSGHCAATCGLSSPCAWSSDTETFDGACLYLTAVTSETAGVGDFGFCTPTCSCSEECGQDGAVCALLPDGELNQAFTGPGLCFGAEAELTPIDQCRP